MRIGLWVGMAVLLSVSPIWGISPFSASDNIVEKQAIRRHELAWIRATVELDRLSISDRDALSELRVERDLAFNRLRIREMRRVHRAHIESRSTLSDILNPKTPTEPVFDLTPTPVPKRSIQSDFQFPSFNIRASGYKNFDFNYSKGQADTGFTRSESLKLNLTGYSQDVTVNVAIDQSSLNSADQNKIQIELLHPNAQVVMGAFKTDFVSFDILKYNAQLDGIQGDFRVGSHNAGVIYSVAKGVRKKDVLYGNNSQGPFVIRFVPVVPNSEQVVLNGVVQARDQDYQIDYPSGTVRFIKRILVPEDQLILSYESENETYKDQVLGARYWMLTGQGDGIGATVIQKNDQGDQGGQTTFLKRRVAVLAADQTWASSNVHLEYAGSDMETVGNPDHTLGTASSIRLKSDDALGRWEGYWTSIGNGFQSIDSSGVTPGDVKYGGRWSRRVSQWVFGTGFDAAFQTINSIPTIEQTSQFQFETVWNTIHYKGSGQTMGHSESPVSGNKLADYRRSLADLAIEIPEHFGTVGIQGKIERREDYVATANSFDAITVASGYTLTPSDF
ncbi:hypothetical protein EBR57_01375, partial [bacterium]|nr:hypothetical protein [bacterium]